MLPRTELDVPKSSYFEHLTGGHGWSQHKATYRQASSDASSGGCAALQFANPHFNPDGAGVNWDELSPGEEAVVLTRIEWREGTPDSDCVYKAGAHLKPGHRMTYLVAYRDRGDSYGPVDDGVEIARYQLLSTPSTGSGRLDVVSRGKIVHCAVSHPPGTNGSFIGCKDAHRLMTLSTSYGIPLKSLLDARHCTWLGISFQNPAAITSKCTAQRAKKMAALAKQVPVARRSDFLAAFRPAIGDESIDAYWFPCANGCCIASASLE